MLIRSTPYACFVMLRNGLTLELVYDRGLTGSDTVAERSVTRDDPAPSASCGVWLMGETVLTEVVAGQA